MRYAKKRMRPRRLPRDDAGNGWYNTLPAPPPATPVTGTIRADWAILGAGACGLAVARRLAELRPDDSIALIDAARVGYGASGRNAGFMLGHHIAHGSNKDAAVVDRNGRLCTAGHGYLRDLVQQHQIRCDWSDWGRVYVADTTDGVTHLEGLAEGYASIGVPFAWRDAGSMRALTGSDRYLRGLHAEGNALVQPAALMRGLAQVLPANVRLLEDSPVTEVHRDGGYRLVCPSGEVLAPSLILTNSVFAEELGILRHRVVPIGTFASLTRVLTDEELSKFGISGEFGLLPVAPSGSTVRLTRDNRILMRHGVIYARDKGFDADRLAEMQAVHRRSIGLRWPGLEDIELAGTWGGMLGFTRNEGTVFGEIGPGLHAVISSDAAPVTRGSIAGKLLAEQLAGQDSELLGLMRSIPTAAILPPDPILRVVVGRRLPPIGEAPTAIGEA